MDGSHQVAPLSAPYLEALGTPSMDYNLKIREWNLGDNASIERC